MSRDEIKRIVGLADKFEILSVELAWMVELIERQRQRIHDLETNCDPAGMVATNALLSDQNSALQRKIEMQHKAVAWHRAQLRDDRCWKDHNELYAAFGLPPGDFGVGDQCAMLENCKRYLAQETIAGGGWKSYADLEVLLIRYGDHTPDCCHALLPSCDCGWDAIAGELKAS